MVSEGLYYFKNCAKRSLEVVLVEGRAGERGVWYWRRGKLGNRPNRLLRYVDSVPARAQLRRCQRRCQATSRMFAFPTGSQRQLWRRRRRRRQRRCPCNSRRYL